MIWNSGSGEAVELIRFWINFETMFIVYLNEFYLLPEILGFILRCYLSP